MQSNILDSRIDLFRQKSVFWSIWYQFSSHEFTWGQHNIQTFQSPQYWKENPFYIKYDNATINMWEEIITKSNIKYSIKEYVCFLFSSELSINCYLKKHQKEQIQSITNCKCQQYGGQSAMTMADPIFFPSDWHIFNISLHWNGPFPSHFLAIYLQCLTDTLGLKM